MCFVHNAQCNARIGTELRDIQQDSAQYDVALLADARDGGYI